MATTPGSMQMEKRAFEEPDELRPAGRGRGEIVKMNEMTFSRATLEPGWRWSTDVQPIAKTESCQAVHTGVVLSGRLHIRMDDGSEDELGPGAVYHIPAGHDAWVVGDETYVGLDITGHERWAKPA